MDAKPYPFTPEQEAWLHDLETTEEPQTKGKLHRLLDYSSIQPAGFCCLGRACVVFGFEGHPQMDVMAFDGNTGALPLNLSKRLRLRSCVGALANRHEGCDHLAALNDSGWSFKQIAAYIRANPENVFLPLEGEV